MARAAWASKRARANSGWLPYAWVVAFSVVFVSRQSVRIDGSRVFVLFEDTMVSMRYAANMARGHGLVWNIGAKPSEGFTDPLWTLWMAAVHWVGIGRTTISAVIAVCGCLLVLATMGVAGRLAARLAPEEPAARPIAVWLIALCFPLLFWSLLGTEVALVSFLILFAVDQTSLWETTARNGHLVLASGAIALGVLTRQDTLVAAAVMLGYVAVRSAGQARWRRVGLFALPVALSVVALTAVQLAVFGKVFPNTYYLKIAHIPLGVRVQRGLDDLVTASVAGLYVLFVLAGSFLWICRRRTQPVAVLLIAILVGVCFYTVWVGGDTYDDLAGPGRFVVSALPCLLVVAALGILVLLRHARTTLKPLLVVGALLLVGSLARLADLRPMAGGRFGALQAEPIPWRVTGPLAALAAVAVLAVASRIAPASPLRWAAMPSLLAAVGLVAASFTGRDLVGWATRGATDANVELQFNLDQARLAFGIQRATSGHAVVATSAIGEIGYFSGRSVVDLLGFTDPHIAAEPPRTTSLPPGHEKWDLQYSLTQFHPDLIFEGWPVVTDSDQSLLHAMGYDRIASDIYVLHGTSAVNVSRVVALLEGQR